ncbi:MAG: hypothetical protein Q8W44_13140 [Candidatus Palauibacterales bacterium]|nr:hypothetical protein [Candidatus Palauibacterales bacterium]
MQRKTFRGSDLTHLLGEVRRSLGEDAMILETRHDGGPDGDRVEVTATTSETVEGLCRRFTEDGSEPSLAGPAGGGPGVVALVGPTGAGKTLTAAKIALSPDGFGRRAGLMSLDTYRPAGFETLSVYAEVAGLPLEVIYHPDEARGALQRLSSADAVVVDTPGRSPESSGDDEWKEIFGRLRPDEVHLVMPAHLRPDVAREVASSYRPFGVTHLLLTKVDEVPDSMATDLAMELDLPARWIATGQSVPGDLEPSGPRILSSLGLSPDQRTAAGGGR